MYNVFEVLNWLRIRNAKDLASENVNAEALTQMKAMKLLYYIQGAYLEKYGRRLFDSDIVAWKYGPVVVEVHDEYAGKRNIVNGYTQADIEDYEKLENDPEAREILCEVYITLGSYSAYTLMKKTHDELPWKYTSQSCKISDSKIRDYFASKSFNKTLEKKFKKMDPKGFNKLKELEYLEKTGTLDTVFKRMKNATDNDFEEL